MTAAISTCCEQWCSQHEERDQWLAIDGTGHRTFAVKIRRDAGRRWPRTGHPQVCYKQLAIRIYGPAAPITVASWDT
jgi:hypothetical protein